MEVISARINSFKKSKRVKNPAKPSSTVSLKWPHPAAFKANPETLAEAGFYYDPAYEDTDNVTCYMCEKELGGWEEDDDPFLLHWEKCGQHCCWASVRCGLRVDIDRSGRLVNSDKTRNPTHKLMEKARLETFSAGKGWVHDQAKSHGANSVMMARAGFVYAPLHSGDDLATCLYCGTSLSGWDADDDPMDEHRKRAAKSDIPCAFFMALEPPSRSQSTKPPSKAQTKPSSKSTSKTKYQDVVVPTKTFDGDEEESDAAVETVKPAKSTAKTPRKPRSTSSSTTRKSSAKTPKAKPRSTSRSELQDVAEDEENEEEEEVVEALKPSRKKAPSRSKSVVKSDVQTEYDDDEAEPPAPSTVKKKSRVRSKSVARQDAAAEEEDEILAAPPPVKKRTKATKGAVKSDVEMESEVETRKPTRKASKTIQSHNEAGEEEVPRKSRSKAKASIVPEAAEVQRKTSRSKSKLSVAPSVATEQPRKPSRPNSKSKPQDSEQENIVEESEEEAQKPAPKPKPQRTTSKSKASVPIPVSESEQEEEKVAEDVPKKKPSKSKAVPASKAAVIEDDAPPPSPPPAELSELFIPKRQAAAAPLSKPASKSMNVDTKVKPVAQPPKTRKVVEISSDEETDSRDPVHDEPAPRSEDMEVESFPQPQFVTPPRPSSRVGQKRSITVETIQPPQEKRAISPEPPEQPNDNDVHIDHDGDHDMGDVPAPSTPPRQTNATILGNSMQPPSTSSQSAPPAKPAEPLFIPPLSKLPFKPAQSLTDAELDMTVEEWIRYQMDVEFDKFRRDGQRELQLFRKKAEEARKIIEGL